MTAWNTSSGLPVRHASTAISSTIAVVLVSGRTVWGRSPTWTEFRAPLLAKTGTSTQQSGGRFVMRPLFGTFPLKQNGSPPSHAWRMDAAYSWPRARFRGSGFSSQLMMPSFQLCSIFRYSSRMYA